MRTDTERNLPPACEQFLFSPDDPFSWFHSNQLSDWLDIPWYGPPGDIDLDTLVYQSQNLRGAETEEKLYTPDACICRRYLIFHDGETDEPWDIDAVQNNNMGTPDCPYHGKLVLEDIQYRIGHSITLPLWIAGFPDSEAYRRQYEKWRTSRQYQNQRDITKIAGRYIVTTRNHGLLLLSELPYVASMVPIDLEPALDILESYYLTFASDIIYRRAFGTWKPTEYDYNYYNDEVGEPPPEQLPERSPPERRHEFITLSRKPLLEILTDYGMEGVYRKPDERQIRQDIPVRMSADKLKDAVNRPRYCE